MPFWIRAAGAGVRASTLCLRGQAPPGHTQPSLVRVTRGDAQVWEVALEKMPLPFVWVLGAGAAGLSLETWDVNSAHGTVCVAGGEEAGEWRGRGTIPQGALGETHTGHECPQELLGSGI